MTEKISTTGTWSMCINGICLKAGIVKKSIRKAEPDWRGSGSSQVFTQ